MKNAITYAKNSQLTNNIVKCVDLSGYTRGDMKIANKSSYCTTYKGYLCIGTHNEDYSSENKLVFYQPVVNGSGLPSLTVISNLPVKTQGALFHTIGSQTYFLVTTSLGRWNISQCYSYVYVYIVTGEIQKVTNTKIIIMPPMMEEVAVYGNNVYFVFESCGEMYRNYGASPVIGNICGFNNTFIFK